MNSSRSNKLGIASLVLGATLFTLPLGILKLFYPFDVESNKYIVLVAGIIIVIGFGLISVSLLIFPKYLFAPYGFLLLIITSYGIESGYSLNMVPPPEWVTEKYGWPLANREVVIHYINREIVDKKDQFLWRNSIINFSLFSLIGISVFSLKSIYMKIRKS